MNVLIVDDNEDNVDLMRIMLTSRGYDVSEAANGEEALNLAVGQPPDIIVSDILMPVMDGFALCKAWKNEPTLNQIPFIFYTATYTEPKDVAFALSLGADKFLIKPMESEIFLYNVEQVIAKFCKASSTTKKSIKNSETTSYQKYDTHLTKKRKEKQEALNTNKHVWAESEQRYQNLIEEMHELVQSVDGEGKFMFVNRAWREDLGYTSQEVDELTIWDIIHPDSMSHFQDLFKKIMSGESVSHLEATFRSKAGVAIDVEGSVTARVMDGKVIASHGIFRDITARKQAESERMRMEEVLRRTQKMEAIGQLSGGIAHDFNNQLGIIIGYLDLLKNQFPKNTEPRKWIETTSKATLRCADLTRQLLSFSRKQGKGKVVVDINAALMDLEPMITRSVTPEIEMQISLSDTLWSTEINPGEFQDVILNLVINARDAMPNGGKLLLETSNKHLDTDYAEHNRDLEPGDYVQLMLNDTGIGMDKETLEHLFEPFFTNKSEGKGAGLGMAMVYGFVKRYGGYITIFSKPDMGTKICLYLPRSKATETATKLSNG